MSEQNTTVVTAEQEKAAFNQLYSQVWAPTFLNKMAALGYPARTEAEARELLVLSDKLDQYQTAPATPGVGMSKVSEALGALNAYLASQGIHDAELNAVVNPDAPSADGLTPWAKSAAQQVAANAELLSAAETLHKARTARTQPAAA